MSSRSVAAAVALPPGADASAVADHVETTVIAVPPVVDKENEEFDDNYHLDSEGSGGEYTLCQKMVHYCVGWQECENMKIGYAFKK